MESTTRLRARLGGLTRASMYDGLEVTSAARAAYRQSFEVLVDPERKLPEGERARRAEAARKAHYTRLALASVKARAKKKNAEARPTSATEVHLDHARSAEAV